MTNFEYNEIMIQILPLNQNDKNLFEEIYKDMLIQFPTEELKSKAHFQKLFESEDYIFSIICSNNDKIGYITHTKTESGHIWVDYYAIYREFQSSGFGSKALKKLFEENKDSKGCFFEVEPINPEKENTAKRQKFYTRLGCKKFDFAYLFPNKDGDFPLELFYMPIGTDTLSKTEIAEQIQKTFKLIHYDVVTYNETLKNIKGLNGL